MVDKNFIEADIRKLDSLFNSSSDAFQQKCFAKLSLIEFCGWIEDSSDCIARDYCIRKTSDPTIFTECEKIIKRTNGLKYFKLQELFTATFGMVNFIELEKQVENDLGLASFIKFKSTLGVIGEERNRYAHTHLQNIQFPYAPSYILQKWLEDIFLGLKSFETLVSRM